MSSNGMQQKSKEGLAEFFSSIYMWMFVGILISGAFSYLTLFQGLGNIIFSNSFYYYGLIALQLAILFGVQLLIKTFSPRASMILYLVYAAINGIVLAGIFLIYTLNSIMIIFATSALMFLGLAVYGYTTKKDLSNWGTVLFVGMLGVFFSSIANIFFQNTFFDMLISAVAVFVFAGLTVYDNQMFKKLYHQASREDEQRYIVLGALFMYINFIMIFINLLRLFGDRR
ncbi:MAG: FtsH-binding integral membrane protein [Patescibacteria group bacterium]|jgi:FtsH-binding integral membrane protein